MARKRSRTAHKTCLLLILAAAVTLALASPNLTGAAWQDGLAVQVRLEAKKPPEPKGQTYAAPTANPEQQAAKPAAGQRDDQPASPPPPTETVPPGDVPPAEPPPDKGEPTEVIPQTALDQGEATDVNPQMARETPQETPEPEVPPPPSEPAGEPGS